MLQKVAETSGYKNFDFALALKDDKLAKMLEHFNYTFFTQNFAMIILKHYTRHRIQSLSTEPIVKMAMKDKFVCPESIGSNKNLKNQYVLALKENRKVFNTLIDQNVDPYLLIYATPHAVAIDFVSTMNARELLHLCNLRNCNRAQWEIRNLSVSMLRQVKKADPKMFENFGPSCYTYGVCPEGRLCCGKQAEMKEKFKNLQNS